MNVEKGIKVNEAVQRMKTLGYWGRAREAFRRSGKVFVNEPPFGAVYDPEPGLAEFIEKFEKDHNALVYMVVRAFTEFGKMDSLLYVSDQEDEWVYDNEDLADGIVMTYTINYDMPDCSEFGSIQVKLTAAGGLKRIA